MSTYASGDGGSEAVVTMVVGFVDNRQMRRASIGAAQVAAMAGRTVRRVELAAPSCAGRIEGGLVGAVAARHERGQGEGQGERRCEQRPPRASI